MSTSARASETEPPPELRVAWHVHVSADARSLEHLIERHQSPDRHYHGVAHVRSVVATALDLIDASSNTGDPVDDPGVVVAAAFFHDAAYDVTASDNEVRSADLARRELIGVGWPHERVARVATMIVGTADHRNPSDAGAATLFDADLAILGADVTVYDRYVEAVRAEYAAVPDGAWRIGRAAVLSSFLERPSVFATSTGIDRWEAAARSNLERELSSLTA